MLQRLLDPAVHQGWQVPSARYLPAVLLSLQDSVAVTCSAAQPALADGLRKAIVPELGLAALVGFRRPRRERPCLCSV